MKTILYAEDREDDVFFFNRACQRAGVTPHARVQVVPNGGRAIDYLAGSGAFADRAQHPRPDLVVLDVKMPVKSGLEVLAWIRAQPEFAELPVYLLTSSNQESDMQRGARLGANGYLIKSGDLAELARMVGELKERWLREPAESAPRRATPA